MGGYGQGVIRAEHALGRLLVPEMVEDRDLPGFGPSGRVLELPVEQPCVVRGHIAYVVQTCEPASHDLLSRYPEGEGDLFGVLLAQPSVQDGELAQLEQLGERPRP